MEKHARVSRRLTTNARMRRLCSFAGHFPGATRTRTFSFCAMSTRTLVLGVGGCATPSPNRPTWFSRSGEAYAPGDAIASRAPRNTTNAAVLREHFSETPRARGKNLTGTREPRRTEKKNRKVCGLATPSTLIERPRDEAVCKKSQTTEDLFRETRRKKALSEAFREGRRSAHFTRAARSHTHPSHFHPASAHESATALARTHARSTRTRSRPAEAFSRQTEHLIGRLVSKRALRDVRLHDGLRSGRRGQRERRQGVGSSHRRPRAVPRRAPLRPPRGLPPPPARFVGVDVDAARSGRPARGGAPRGTPTRRARTWTPTSPRPGFRPSRTRSRTSPRASSWWCWTTRTARTRVT